MTNMIVVDEKKVTILASEILTLGLLGKLLYEYPEKEFYTQLIEERVLDEIPFETNPSLQEGMVLIQKWTQEHAPGLDAGWFDTLLHDYTRLFIGPDKVLAPPWESVFVQEGRLVFTETTLEVRQWYRRFGLELENLHKEPDDHIGLELAFLANLAGQAVEALETGEEVEYQRLMQAQADFYAAHLGRWSVPYFDQLFEYARTDYFRGLGRLGRGVIFALETLIKSASSYSN